MKNSIYILLIMMMVMSCFSCLKDEKYHTPDEPNQCIFADSSDQNPKSGEYQALLDAYVDKGIPGLITLIYTPNEGLWIGASGYSCIETNTPMQKCNLVYSASIGKTYCAVATLQLVQKGVISLNDPISEYLSKDICDKLLNGNKATIKDLLGHTSGIPNFETGEDFIADVLNDPFKITTESLLEYEYGTNALFEAGQGYKYSSTGYELLAKIIDKVTGESHGKYYTKNIFEPISANNTYYRNEQSYPKPPGLVNCYFDRLGNGKIENVSDVNNYLTSTFTGSDGIIASVYDYYLFINHLFKGNLLSQSLLSEMMEWRDTYSWTKNQYGLGLQKRETPYGDKIGHDGDAMGAGADMFYFPDKDIYIITATNLGTFLDSDLSLLYNDDFQDDLLDIVFN